MRKYAREVAFCLTYEYLFTKERRNNLDMFEEKDLTEEDRSFTLSLYNGTIENIDNYKEIIASLSKGFKLERIFKIDLAIIAMAIHEITAVKTPVAVCVNEAVELAKKFSTDKSVGYVNGVLGEYCRQNDLK
jgi:N utilization substance protein B